MKTMQTLERVKQLKAENEDLQLRIETLSKELRLLKGNKNYLIRLEFSSF